MQAWRLPPSDTDNRETALPGAGWRSDDSERLWQGAIGDATGVQVIGAIAMARSRINLRHVNDVRVSSAYLAIPAKPECLVFLRGASLTQLLSPSRLLSVIVEPLPRARLFDTEPCWATLPA